MNGLPSLPPIFNPAPNAVAQTKKSAVLSPVRFVPPPIYRPQALVKQALPAPLYRSTVVQRAAEQKSAPAPQPTKVKLQWKKVKSKDGDFLGEPASFHIHRVGGDEHYSYGTSSRSRKDYKKNGKITQSNLRDAIENCEKDGTQHGVDETYKIVHDYLKSELVLEPASQPSTVTSVAETTAPLVSQPSDTYNGGLGDDDFI
jgi:hypothetical protein